MAPDGPWFTSHWLPEQLFASIAFKELYPIVLAAHVWGHRWQVLRDQFLRENRSITDANSKCFCSDGALGGLLRSLFLTTARHSFWVSATHVPGHLNSIAVALSRSSRSYFGTPGFSRSHPPARATATEFELVVLQQRVTHFLNVSLAQSTGPVYTPLAPPFQYLSLPWRCSWRTSPLQCPIAP